MNGFDFVGVICLITRLVMELDPATACGNFCTASVSCIIRFLQCPCCNLIIFMLVFIVVVHTVVVFLFLFLFLFLLFFILFFFLTCSSALVLVLLVLLLRLLVIFCIVI